MTPHTLTLGCGPRGPPEVGGCGDREAGLGVASSDGKVGG